jgi:hypothetical protein
MTAASRQTSPYEVGLTSHANICFRQAPGYEPLLRGRPFKVFTAANISALIMQDLQLSRRRQPRKIVARPRVAQRVRDAHGRWVMAESGYKRLI